MNEPLRANQTVDGADDAELDRTQILSDPQATANAIAEATKNEQERHSTMPADVVLLSLIHI